MSSNRIYEFDKIFNPLYELPCWNIKQGNGSFLTFEFGKPRIEIREPSLSKKGDSKKLRELNEKRVVTLLGDWHLWIYCCSWFIYMNDKEIAYSESSRRKIENALWYLDGQVLQQVSINPVNGDTVFVFDLGGRLETHKSYCLNKDERASNLSLSPDELEIGPDEQWMLFEPSGMVLCIRSDGKYSYQLGDTPCEEVTWRRIK